MTHPLVEQLRFTRSEWLRALNELPAADAERRLMPINSISWTVGHLAWQEHTYWLIRAQGKNIAPHLDALVGFGAPASTPPYEEMLTTWKTITSAADPFLDQLTVEQLLTHPIVNGEPHFQTLGSMMLRMTYHYWYHIGEIMAVRQVYDHPSRPDFVGDIQSQAPFRV